MKASALIAACLAVGGCRAPTKQRAYEELARRLNPFLLMLQPTKVKLDHCRPYGERSRFYDEHPAAVNQAVEAFMEARDILSGLGKVELSDDASDLLNRTWITFSARAIADPRNRFDREGEPSHFVFYWNSQGEWDSLTTELEQLRFCAAQEGVEILSLGGTRRPDKRCP